MKMLNWVATPMFINGERIAEMRVGNYLRYPIEPGKYSLKLGEGSPQKLFTPQEFEITINSKQAKYIMIQPDSLVNEFGTHLSLSCIELSKEKGEQELEKWKEI